ncbi:MAG: PD40 domain-containing protein [Balneolaceae bacterium]|nr:PD40 domain-containing protein [Balneolaceae bacterium]MCH8547699.1 peptidase S41 [Balneolaceae bacterium]
MKYLILSLFFAFSWNVALAEDDPRWIRYQSISPDGERIAFTYKGNLYVVPAEGGDARQLTFHEGHDHMAVWSHDSERIAFASDRYGNFNVFVMDAEGGPAERLTYHSSDEMPYSFTHDNSHVIFGAVRQDIAEHRQFPAASQPELYKVPAEGGRVGQIFTIPAEFARENSSGSRMVYHDKKGGENEWRKHQRSSITRDIWIYDAETDEHQMVTNFEWENRQPIFTEDEQSLYYLSEENGSFNIFRLFINDPEQREQLTDFSLHPVRFLSYGNGRLAFGYDGELYTMIEGEEPQKVDVRIRTQNRSNPDSYITINGGVQEMDISPNGKEIAFIARGEVFVTSIDGSMTKRITNTPQRERFVRFTPDGDGVVYASERDGKWSIYKTTRVRDEEPFFYASTLLREEILVEGERDKYLPNISPDGKKIAYITDRRRLHVRDLESGETTELLTPEDLFHMQDGDQYFTWSPDSNWLLIGWRKLLHNSEVLLMAADGSERINLTESGYRDSSPVWVNDGKQMIWLSNRDGLRSYATSGRSERDVYTMFFSHEEWDKFNLSEEDYKLMQAIEEARKSDNGDEDENGEEENGDLVFDKDGMKDRTARLTIHSSTLSDAVLSKDGSKLYYLSSFEDNFNLWETDLRTRDTRMLIRLNTGPGSLMWDHDMENLYLLSRGSISKLDLNAGSSSPVQIRGEMTYDEEEERKHMLEHVYIRTKNVFYEPTFHGNDWDMLYEEYQKYLPHIGNSYEFAEMVSEMIGELNVSHAGARYNRSIDNADQTASLGIFKDYEHDGDGILITEVLRGGPLDRAAFDVRPGMIIKEIDGNRIGRDRDIAAFLNRKADTFVLLSLYDPESGEQSEYTVKPITPGAERSLLYDRFVRINEKEVDELSDGRLGYVHIPGMGDGPFRNVIQEMLGKYADREGMIVDTRFNGGGDLVADLAMFFTGESFNTYATEDRAVGGEPTSRWTKPTLSIINEAMYSDGHCYASAYTELEIGTTVGMPVPGTCSFAGWSVLPDGTRWGVVPISAKNKSGEWMENNQTDPMIEVKNMPGKIDQGVDQQLERAVEELLRELSE